MCTTQKQIQEKLQDYVNRYRNVRDFAHSMNSTNLSRVISSGETLFTTVEESENAEIVNLRTRALAIMRAASDELVWRKCRGK